jgi:hypothetical protein
MGEHHLGGKATPEDDKKMGSACSKSLVPAQGQVVQGILQVP